MAQQPVPSVGRIVHYVSYGTPGGEYTSQCRADIVTAVQDGTEGRGVSLAVLNPTGMFFNENCPHYPQDGAGPLPGGSWHWPERV